MCDPQEHYEQWAASQKAKGRTIYREGYRETQRGENDIMRYNANNYRDVEIDVATGLGAFGGEIQLLSCKGCGALIADPEVHDNVDCWRRINPAIGAPW